MIRWLARKLKNAGWYEAAIIAASLHGAIDCFGVFGLAALAFKLRFRRNDARTKR